MLLVLVFDLILCQGSVDDLNLVFSHGFILILAWLLFASIVFESRNALLERLFFIYALENTDSVKK